ncbi:MAG: hypothetical protein ABID83_04550, partial [Candidatus Omnitrophota bacterium]
IASLTEEKIQKIEDIAWMQEVLTVLARILPEGRSYRLSEKSIYQMRMERSYDMFYRKPAKETRRVEYLKDALEAKKDYYIVNYVDAETVLAEGRNAIVPAGLEIEKRRVEMKVTKDTDRLHDKFLVMAPKGIVTDEEKESFREKLMDMWMLEGVVDAEDVTIIDRRGVDHTTSELFAKAGELYGASVTADNTGFRCMAGELDYDEEAEELALLQITLAPGAVSNINQYEVLINLLLSDDEAGLSGIPGLDKSGRGRLYIYLPKAEAIDFEKEIRNYERYIIDILVKA